jgi:hypothetical protein
MTPEIFFDQKLSWNERISNVIGKKHSHIDEHILSRKPQISFLDNGKIDIDKMYAEEIQTSSTSRPYDDYYNCLLETFDDEICEIGTFCDVGCSTGWLVRNMITYADSYGIEYFQFQKEHADPSIMDKILIADIRDPLNLNRKFDLVNCTEVAEHIDPSSLDIFLDNIRKISGKYLTLSWSNSYAPPDAPPQHVSPLFAEDVHKIMSSWGYEYQHQKTQKFLSVSQKYNNFYYWWRDGYSIWKVKQH